MGNTIAAFKELIQRYHLVWQHASGRNVNADYLYGELE